MHTRSSTALNVGEAGSFKKVDTQNSPGAVCVAVLAVNQQEEETPTGLQVHQAVSPSGADCRRSVTNTD